jgi:hypothetical protein
MVARCDGAIVGRGLSSSPTSRWQKRCLSIAQGIDPVEGDERVGVDGSRTQVAEVAVANLDQIFEDGLGERVQAKLTYGWKNVAVEHGCTHDFG